MLFCKDSGHNAGLVFTYIILFKEECVMTKKILAFFCLLAILAGGSTAFAKTIRFEVYRDEGATQVTTNRKEIAGSKWYVSNQDTSYSNFKENKDVIDFRTLNKNNDAISTWHSFSKFVYRYALNYTSTPANNAELRLNSRVNSKSEYVWIAYEGEWLT